jgi:hypothetical protein
MNFSSFVVRQRAPEGGGRAVGRHGGLLAEEPSNRHPVPPHRVRNGAKRTNRIRKSSSTIKSSI